MRIRDARARDAAVLAVLQRHVHDIHLAAQPTYFVPVSRNDAVEFFAGIINPDDQDDGDDPGQQVIVVADDEGAGGVVGYVWASEMRRSASLFTRPYAILYVNQVVVDPHHRHRGVARGLLAAVDEVARRRSIERVELDAWAFNGPARDAFRALGFDPVHVHYRRDVN